jgi:hypothetical protein
VVHFQLIEMQPGIFFLEAGDQGFDVLTVNAPIAIEVDC